MKAWITKYALTRGIYQEIGELRSTCGPDYFSVIDKHQIFYKGDYFYSKEDAIKNAKEKRKKKITSLEKQIVKLGNLEF